MADSPHSRLGWRLTLAAVLVLAALWVVLSLVLPAYLAPSPLSVGRGVLQFFTQWGYGKHALATVFHVAASIVGAFLLGGVLATCAYFFPVLDLLVHHRLSPFANAFSSIGWTILMVVWLGVGQETVLVATILILLPFVLINLKAGFDTLEGEQMEMALSFTRRKMRRLILVVLPMLVPYVFAALRITFGVACQSVLVTELFGGNDGLGYLVNLASQEVDTPLIFAVALMMVAAFLACDRWLLAPLQRRATRVYGCA